MSSENDYDVCAECGKPLPEEDSGADLMKRTPCPHCGSTKRVMSASADIRASVSVSIDARLIISWQEVDRLLAKAEYAAALLIAAVNVEFILREKLKGLAPISPPPKNLHSLRTAWGRVKKKSGSDQASLGSLVSLAEYFVANNTLSLSPSLASFARSLTEARKGIAHERGYFAKLTQLNDADWAETRVRQVLQDAKQFCHGNAP